MGKHTMSRTNRSIANDTFRAPVLTGMAVTLLLAFGSNVMALPSGGAVSAGTATISGSPGNLTITQTSQRASINWQSFSIGQAEAVRFVQPDSSSVALNRVLGPDASSILGSLSANGKVFLVNPNGILFGAGSQVNVGGLVASTRNITDGDFMAGNYRFAGNSGARILNQGTIHADGGYVALLGADISNEGVISARLGSVTLAAGNAMTLDVAGDSLLSVVVNEGAVDTLVSNGGMIRADGGNVLLTARSAGNLLQSAVNNTGVIQAQTIVERNGTIMLMGDMQHGTVNAGGTLDASAPNGGNGGFIETSAASVKITGSARVTTAAPQGTTGTWLIDPLDFTVGSAGGDNITGATLSANVQDSNVTITTVAGPGPGNGDIFVTEAVTWNGLVGASGASTTLTLNALRNISIGRNSAGLAFPAAAITPTNGSLVLNAGQDVVIDAAISVTRGNLVACCGQDINVNAAITTVNGSVLLSAGRDVNVFRTIANPTAAITTTDGNIELCAGRDVNLSNTFNPGVSLMTLTRGSTTGGQDLATLNVPLGMTLSGGVAGTGPGIAAGTVNFANAGTLVTVTAGGPGTPVTVIYNPVNYSTPTSYGANFNGTASAGVTARMLVFPDGATKAADGTTTTTFTGLKVDALGALPAGVNLAGAGTANFDTAAVGVGKRVSFTGYTLAGPNAANFSFANSCCGPVVGRTVAAITPAVVVLPPVDVLPLAAILPVGAIAALDGDLADFLPETALLSARPMVAPALDLAVVDGGVRLPPLAEVRRPAPPPPAAVVPPPAPPPVPLPVVPLLPKPDRS